MSGRKASEVNSLLRNAAKTRTNSMDVLDGIYNKIVDHTKVANIKADELKQVFDSDEYEICDEAVKEFEKNSTDIKEEISRLKTKIFGLHFEVDDKEYSKLLNEYKKVDTEADEVRREVNRKINSQGRSDPWYCDSEFEHARQVQNKYKILSDKTNKLNSSMSSTASSLNSSIQIIDEYRKQAIKLQEMVSNLNKKAKDLVKLRAEASSAKSEIEKEFASINSEIAEKFLKDQYQKIKEKVRNYLEQTDTEVVKLFTNMTVELTGFTNNLQVLYADYLECQGAVRGRIQSLEERINNKAYSNPEDEFKSGSKEMFSLVEFIKKYGDFSQVKIIQEQLGECKKFYQNDDFDAANKSIEKLIDLINQVANSASLIHENRMKTIINMLSIKKAMLELRYDVEVTKNEVDDDGYCISCTAGDECIKFDKVTVIDDGQPVITIDHKEATNGTCAASWYEIRKKLSEEGLYIEDITKNGKSIHIANSVCKQETSGSVMTSHS